jgi:hypothetical protein
MERCVKLGRLASGLFAATAFPVAIVLIALPIAMVRACRQFAAGQADLDYSGSDAVAKLVTAALFACALACASFVYRACRGRISSTTLFHTCFGLGFGLLCYSLWLCLMSFPLWEGPFVADRQDTKIVEPLFTWAILCLVLVPSGLLSVLLGIALDAPPNSSSRKSRADGSARRSTHSGLPPS